jgi:N-acetylglutamate synthase-like GNAT family acetyltransferase
MKVDEKGAVIRRARREDIAGILACLAAAFAPYRGQYTPDGFRDTVLTSEAAAVRLREMTVLVAEQDGVIVGTLAHHPAREGEGHLRGMAVLPVVQGQGVAERLLQAAESELRESGCARVTLDTTRPLQRAVRFYTRHGYEATGATRDYFGMPLFERAKTLK